MERETGLSVACFDLMRICSSLIAALIVASCAYAQRRTPLTDPYLRTDMDADYRSITNLASLVFYKDGSNLVVDLDTFVAALAGNAIKLNDPSGVGSYLYVSNGSPYIVGSGEAVKVVLESDGTFIRQHDHHGTVTNMTVLNDLVIQYPSDVDDSEYSVTHQALTNGAIEKIRIGRYYFQDDGGLLTISNAIDGAVNQLVP